MNKNDCWKIQENDTEKQLERNNKERLKNNILIKIEFWDAGGFVKWKHPKVILCNSILSLISPSFSSSIHKTSMEVLNLLSP